jgi:hypothetical protein
MLKPRSFEVRQCPGGSLVIELPVLICPDGETAEPEDGLV